MPNNDMNIMYLNTKNELVNAAYLNMLNKLHLLNTRSGESWFSGLGEPGPSWSGNANGSSDMPSCVADCQANTHQSQSNCQHQCQAGLW